MPKRTLKVVAPIVPRVRKTTKLAIYATTT